MPAVALHRVVSLACLLAAAAAEAQPAAQLAAQPPFAAGERLTYRARVGKVGSGRGAMWVEGPVDVRGTPTWVLRMEVRGGLGPVKGADRTESWLDPRRMAALRFAKHERSPFSSHDERVELFPAERRWESPAGGGASPTDAPLDELSFIYFVRTLELAADTVYRFDRHFDPGRNPVSLRVLSRETVSTPAGQFRATLVEMRVRDPRRYKGGQGVIRIHLSDDERRLPVRIESAIPGLGAAVLTLESYTPPRAPALARAGETLTGPR